jgi:integrase
MSGIFAHAVALGHVKMNPIHDARLLSKPRAPQEAPHYTIEEMKSVLMALHDEPQALVAMALAFLGLNRAEIRGVRWEDIRGSVLRVRRSVWGKSHISEGGKSARRSRDVTIGPLLVSILNHYKLNGPPSVNGFVLENSAGNPLELGQFSTRTIRPLFKKHGLEWKGYHAGRRGAETEMDRYTNGNSQITSHHFGHSKEVADAHYVKPLPEETRKAALAFDRALSEGQQGTESPQVIVAP